MLMLNFSLLLCPFQAFYVQKEISTPDDYCLLVVFLITYFQDTQLTFCWKQDFFPPLKQTSDSQFNINFF